MDAHFAGSAPAMTDKMPVTSTSKRGRRAASSLWNAIRLLTDAALTPDDQAVLAEALDDLRVILEACNG